MSKDIFFKKVNYHSMEPNYETTAPTCVYIGCHPDNIDWLLDNMIPEFEGHPIFCTPYAPINDVYLIDPTHIKYTPSIKLWSFGKN